MTKEELLEFKYTYGYFKIDDLTYGYMTILFFQPPCTYTKVSFDECLEDSCSKHGSNIQCTKTPQTVRFFH